MSEWKPIETIPKDRPVIGYWSYWYHGNDSPTCGWAIIEWDAERQQFIDHQDGIEVIRLSGDTIWKAWIDLPLFPKEVP